MYERDSKDDSVSQCNSIEKLKFDPPTVSETPEPMVTKFGMGDDVWDPMHPCAKFYYDPIRLPRVLRVLQLTMRIIA